MTNTIAFTSDNNELVNSIITVASKLGTITKLGAEITDNGFVTIDFFSDITQIGFDSERQILEKFILSECLKTLETIKGRILIEYNNSNLEQLKIKKNIK